MVWVFLSVCIHKSISVWLCESSITGGCVLYRLLPSTGYNKKTVRCSQPLQFSQPALKSEKVKLVNSKSTNLNVNLIQNTLTETPTIMFEQIPQHHGPINQCNIKLTIPNI